MRVATIGAGYVGLVSAACFSEFGCSVTCVDAAPERIAALRAGLLPIHEPGLERLVAANVAAGRLAFTSDIADAVPSADVVMLAVGTPGRRGYGRADPSFVYCVGGQTPKGRALSHYGAPAAGPRYAVPVPIIASLRDAENTEFDGLHTRLLRAGREALDDRELLQLLLSGWHPAAEARKLAEVLLDAFGSSARVLAARPDKLRTVAGLGESGITAVKTAEALSIAMARAALPKRFHPKLSGYDKVFEYCRSLVGHRDAEEFRVLFCDFRHQLIRDELMQTGTINYTAIYPRQVCVRALEVGASGLIVLHQHPSGASWPSQADIELTKTLRDALQTIDVVLHDHIIVSINDEFSFSQNGII